MQFMIPGIRNIAVAAMSLMLGGCVGLNKMVTGFEERWDNPTGVLENGENAALTEEQIAALSDKMNEEAEAGDCENAMPPANQLVAIDENNVGALLVLGECNLNARDLASAKLRFEAANTPVKNERALRGLGAVAVLEEKPEDARQYLYEAIALYSGDWKTWNSLGYAEDLLENWGEAENAYRRAASLDAKIAAPLNNLGMSYVRQQRFDEAIVVFNDALRREPSLEIAHLNLRIAHAMKGDYATALAGADERERAVVLNNVGVAAMARGELDVAKRLFRQALDANPTFYDVAFNNLERAKLMSKE
jgi:Flp pilus assembly protein TadD